MGLAVMALGVVLVVVALVANVTRDDGPDQAGRTDGGTTTSATGSAPTVPAQGEVRSGTTAPTTPAGLGAGVAPAVRGRHPLRGFSEVTATITAGDGTTCEVCLLAATTEAQRQRGLMEVTDPELGGYDGMVFRYPAPIAGQFWMRDTPMPLSIAYFDEDGRLVSTDDMAPCKDSPDCTGYPADGPFLTALEVPKGKLADVGVSGKARIVIRVEDCPLRKAG